jgi:hypothetical protein
MSTGQAVGSIATYQLLVQFCDKYRLQALNEMYYRERLTLYKRLDFWANLIVAAFATSSPIMTWRVWETPNGRALSTAFLSFVAVLAWAAKAFNWQSKVEHYARLYSGYRNLRFQYEDILESMKRDAIGWVEVERSYADFQKVSRQLLVDDDLAPNKKVKNRCEAAIRAKYPGSYFALPRDLRR